MAAAHSPAKDVKDVKSVTATNKSAARWADEETDTTEEKNEDEKTEDNDTETGKEAETARTGVTTHEYVFTLSSRQNWVAVNQYLLKLSPIRTFLGVTDVENQYVAVLLPRVLQEIHRQITVATKKGTTDKLIVYDLQPLPLTDADLGNWHTHYTDCLYVKLPQRMPHVPLRKHLERFFELIRGKSLVEPKQYEIDIPLTKDGTHHRRQAVIRFFTKEAAERRKKKNPDAQIKMNHRCREVNVAFIRYLFNCHEWPADIPLLDNDPIVNQDTLVTKAVTKAVTVVDDDSDDDNFADPNPPQIEPQYAMYCDFNRRQTSQSYHSRSRHHSRK